MSDDEKHRAVIEATDWMLPALKEQAEQSKADPQVREKFNEQAADWIISLVEEIEQRQSIERSLRNQVATYEKALKVWEQTGKHIESQLATVFEEIKRGKDPAELYESYLRNLAARKDDDDDLVN